MEFNITSLPKSEIEIKVTIPFPEFEPHLSRAASVISEEAEIEGFRRGKAPYDTVKNKFGEAAIYERAAEIAVRKTYPEILEKIIREKSDAGEDFVPIGRPEVTITKLAPKNELEFKVKLALLPKVSLPDYKAAALYAKKEKKEVTVTDEEVNKTIDWVRESRVPRPDSGSGRDPGRVSDLGTTGEGENHKVPELTDDFAKGLGNFSSVDALKAGIKDGLGKEKAEKENQRIRSMMAEEIAKGISAEISEVLVTAELEKMFAELKSGIQSMGLKWEDYLAHIKKTPEELEKEWRPEAEKRVKAALALRAIASQEKITVSEEEITERANQFLRQYGSPEEAEKEIDAEELKEYIRGVIRNEKVFEFLESIN